MAARSHPNVVAAQRWLNNFWHPSSAEENQEFMKGVVLDQPLSYADRFRIRNPDRNEKWTFFPPHIDGEHSCVTKPFFPDDRTLGAPKVAQLNDGRTPLCANALKGSFRGTGSHSMSSTISLICGLSNRSSDAFTLDGRVHALTDLYGRPNQCSVWRTWQGWLSMRCDPAPLIVHSGADAFIDQLDWSR